MIPRSAKPDPLELGLPPALLTGGGADVFALCFNTGTVVLLLVGATVGPVRAAGLGRPQPVVPRADLVHFGLAEPPGDLRVIGHGG